MQKVEKNNLKIVLNVFYPKKGKTYPAYVSKHNSIPEKQDIFLMIPNREGWHYPAVKKLSALLRGITSKHHGDFYCLNCLHSLLEKTNVNLIKKYVKKKVFYNVVIPAKDRKTLENVCM